MNNRIAKQLDGCNASCCSDFKPIILHFDDKKLQPLRLIPYYCISGGFFNYFKLLCIFQHLYTLFWKRMRCIFRYLACKIMVFVKFFEV